MLKKVQSLLHQLAQKSLSTKEYTKGFEAEIVAMKWFRKELKLGVLMGKMPDYTYLIIQMDGDHLNILMTTTLNIHFPIESISIHEVEKLVLLKGEKDLVITHFDSGKLLHQIHIKNGIRDADFYVDRPKIWFLPIIRSGNVEWGEWSLEDNQIKRFETECFAHYCRGVILHPSQKLIGVLWNTYDNGFLIHQKSPTNPDKLNYYHFDEEEECCRSEYENRLPQFHPIGHEIAFIVNPFHGYQTIEKLCVYNIFKPSEAIYETKLGDYRKIKILSYAFNLSLEAIILAYHNKIKIFYYKAQVEQTIIKEAIDGFDSHLLAPYIARSKGKNLKITQIVTESTSKFLYEKIQEEAIQTAEDFMHKNQDKCREVENN